jgi:predicted alpha/beta hydrolase family esterase
MVKAIFIPGNGGGGPHDYWFPYLQRELEKLDIRVIASEFPDNQLAREAYWIPFLQDVLKPDEQTILVGYSSGAIAAMRYAEKHKLLGSVLVGAYHTDLGIPTETISGYFDRPWEWEKIIKNQQWILQFSSIDDPLIPIEEARFVHEKLKTDYHEFTNQGHFGKQTFPELLEQLKKKIF